ncbi:MULTISPECIES: type II toxin-antitoxin system VapC family toxin [Rhodopseudomonas]|uniref:DNA-binding protein n=1 Tax=Rhodopseudomonas palustris TaxID=1076 RepID=A0A0D7F323_RHOPL|nr:MULTISPECIES: type II toxin-antitoxin system VapC family toxin [Rhodopseudomonas]KIZ47454.1 DNA-binding protein [Rhodopseudomonas palustris]MDF3813940.1 type II toxin-antitoxin system VapC family toxin [Rhodopseudomonas sp. BAL398]WOK16440.1 type II toxin-antitoxin system VapC family toxin [Rhodopseudomonas sp. BAL398]
MTLVDSNILIDIFSQNPQWWHWSLERMEEAARGGPLIINDVVYAETSIRFRSIDEFDVVLEKARLTISPIPRQALFLAGKAFARYRNAGGTRTGVLPDLFIGAHAEVEGLPLLTRDPQRYRTYFPKVQLIAPAAES